MAKGKSTWKYNKLLTARKNYFSNGGNTNLEGIASVVGTAATDIGNMINNIQANDVKSKAESAIATANGTQMTSQVQGDNYDALMGDWLAYNPLKTVMVLYLERLLLPD